MDRFEFRDLWNTPPTLPTPLTGEWSGEARRIVPRISEFKPIHGVAGCQTAPGLSTARGHWYVEIVFFPVRHGVGSMYISIAPKLIRPERFWSPKRARDAEPGKVDCPSTLPI